MTDRPCTVCGHIAWEQMPDLPAGPNSSVVIDVYREECGYCKLKRRVAKLEAGEAAVLDAMAKVYEPHEKEAERIARIVHKGQFRRDGKTPYITHPQAVALSVPKICRIVAWLHDTIEDGGAVAELLIRDAGIPQIFVDAIYALSKNKWDAYEDYLRRVKANDIACVVKIADIRHNLSDDPTPAQVEKYTKALAFLERE